MNESSTPTKRAFSAEVSQVLQLMIHSLYTNKDIFLRELISNASDACDKLRYLALSDQSLLEGQGELAITLRFYEKDALLEINDNGIGMNEADMVAHLGTIARSGTREFVAGLKNDGSSAGEQIGQFGVGFYSSFMVADQVEVLSRKAGEQEAWLWRSEGLGEYEIEPLKDGHPRGTTIRLHLRDDAKDYLDRYRLGHIVSTYSDHIAFPIRFEATDEEPETLNQGAALWTRAKADITPEQYREFYHHTAHSPDDPWLILHNQVEGKVSYTNLLFVPTMKPFDLFHPDRKRRVKLYAHRVFITDENVDLVPPYLRFLRGIVDSEDLPLNISRETLQENPMLRFIRESVTNRVLTELNKKAKDDAEGFAAFWKHFGAVLKEGLCEANSPREKILEICRFHSTAGEGPTALADYAARMKEGQGEIYFLTGDSLEGLRKSPLLEGFVSREIEVLLFDDHVDDFWVNVVQTYGEKPLKSITRADIDLAGFGGAEGEKPDEVAPAAEDLSTLIERLKAIYGSEVKDVRTTAKLTSTPACLAVAEGDMDMRMERFLLEQRQLSKRSARILELNPAHSLIAGVNARLETIGQAELEDFAFLLFDQAKILEGESIANPAALAKRLNRLMEKSFAA